MMKSHSTVASPDPDNLLKSSKKIPIAHKQTQRQQRIFFTTVFMMFIVSLFFIEVAGYFKGNRTGSNHP